MYIYTSTSKWLLFSSYFYKKVGKIRFTSFHIPVPSCQYINHLLRYLCSAAEEIKPRTAEGASDSRPKRWSRFVTVTYYLHVLWALISQHTKVTVWWHPCFAVHLVVLKVEGVWKFYRLESSKKKVEERSYSGMVTRSKVAHLETNLLHCYIMCAVELIIW